MLAALVKQNEKSTAPGCLPMNMFNVQAVTPTHVCSILNTGSRQCIVPWRNCETEDTYCNGPGKFIMNILALLHTLQIFCNDSLFVL